MKHYYFSPIIEEPLVDEETGDSSGVIGVLSTFRLAIYEGEKLEDSSNLISRYALPVLYAAVASDKGGAIYLIPQGDILREYGNPRIFIEIGSVVHIDQEGTGEFTIPKNTKDAVEKINSIVFPLSLSLELNNTALSPITAHTYTGNPLEPDVVVEVDGKVLERGVEYRLSYTDNLEVGIAEVTVTGIGDYDGEEYTRYFIIQPKQIFSSWISGIGNQTATGERLTPEVEVRDTYEGLLLTDDIDYKKAYINNTEPGKGTVVIYGIGNYTGVASKTFTIT